MNRRQFFWVLIMAGFILASCSMPQGSSELTNTGNPPEEAANLSVETDFSRNQGIYVNEWGQKIDIVSEEGAEGTVVRCIEAINIVEVDEANNFGKSTAAGTRVKALVIGKRDDGHPGVWEIHSDDSIHPVEGKEYGKKSSLLPDSGEIDWSFYGFFGWVYHATMIVGDGQGEWIIVGYAENKEGLKFGKWIIEPGTTVAVYWKLIKTSHGRFNIVSRARIIGTPTEKYNRHWNGPRADFPHRPYHYYLYRLLRYIFSSFKFFSLEWYESYLVMATSAEYDQANDVYRVTGTDQDGSSVVATIDKLGSITIVPAGGPVDLYERIVIDTFHPDGGGWTDTQLTLIDSGGNTLATNDDGNPDQGTHIEYSRIDQADLSAGTYYIKVSSSTGFGSGYYGLRALTYDPGSTFPTPGSQLEASDSDDAVDGNGVPTNPVPIALEKVISRQLNPIATDDDWFKLVLPPLP